MKKIIIENRSLNKSSTYIIITQASDSVSSSGGDLIDVIAIHQEAYPLHLKFLSKSEAECKRRCQWALRMEGQVCHVGRVHHKGVEKHLTCHLLTLLQILYLQYHFILTSQQGRMPLLSWVPIESSSNFF
jgi:hypothetical protein